MVSYDLKLVEVHLGKALCRMEVTEILMCNGDGAVLCFSVTKGLDLLLKLCNSVNYFSINSSDDSISKPRALPFNNVRWRAMCTVLNGWRLEIGIEDESKLMIISMKRDLNCCVGSINIQ